jgi:hypothetical protein
MAALTYPFLVPRGTESLCFTHSPNPLSEEAILEKEEAEYQSQACVFLSFSGY